MREGGGGGGGGVGGGGGEEEERKNELLGYISTEEKLKQSSYPKQQLRTCSPSVTLGHGHCMERIGRQSAFHGGACIHPVQLKKKKKKKKERNEEDIHQFQTGHPGEKIVSF